MAENQKNKTIDLDQLRHDLSNAIGALDTAIVTIRSANNGATGLDEAFDLHSEGMGRLRKVLAAIDAGNESKAGTTSGPR